MSKKPKKCLGPNIRRSSIKCTGGNFITHVWHCEGKIAQRLRDSNTEAYGPLQCLTCGRIVGRKACRDIRTKQREGLVVEQRHLARFKSEQQPTERQNVNLFLHLRQPISEEERRRRQKRYAKLDKKYGEPTGEPMKPQNPDYAPLHTNRVPKGESAHIRELTVEELEKRDELLEKTAKVRRNSAHLIKIIIPRPKKTGKHTKTKKKKAVYNLFGWSN